MPDFKAMTRTNEKNLKKLENGGTVKYLFTMGGRDAYVLIGDGHAPDLLREVSGAKHIAGTMTIKKGGLVDAGTLHVSNCSGRRSELEQYMKTFTKKKLVWA